MFRSSNPPEPARVERVPAPLASGVETVREKAAVAGQALAPRVDAAREKIAPYAATALESFEEAVEWASPRVEEAREAVREKASSAATTVAPKVAAALGSATALSAPLAHEARQRGEAALHALRGELPEEKRRWPAALLFLGVGAVAGFAASMFAKRMSPSAPGPYPTSPPLDLAGRQPVTPVPETVEPPIGEGQVGLASEPGGVTDEPPMPPRP